MIALLQTLSFDFFISVISRFGCFK